ncbi:MAG: formylglycine-generating enzyme family protein [Candidatus Acidiferrales bacterium]
MQSDDIPGSPASPLKNLSIAKTATPPSCCAPAGVHAISHAHEIANLKQNLNADRARADANREVVALPGGTFLMGTDYSGGFPQDGEGPVRAVTLSPFEIDVFPVTNRDFASFVAETAYRTEAEQFGWSFVFWSHIPADRFEELVEDTAAHTPWWCKVPGAFWKQPEGPGSHVNARQNHPVVHVTWTDAAAYSAWASKSLPTEAQWEFAARGGLEQKLYAWGDELTPQGRHMCNIWQGEFPVKDTAEDGYAGSCAVDAFPPNAYGLYSITGNVWEWCADWFHAEFSSSITLRDPSGPATGQARVMKGGSFLCHASYCNRYRVAARTSNTPDSSASNIGFRCAKNRSP